MCVYGGGDKNGFTLPEQNNCKVKDDSEDSAPEQSWVCGSPNAKEQITEPWKTGCLLWWMKWPDSEPVVTNFSQAGWKHNG